jgi:predicted transglutaminase-like cysteine proteinase
MALTVKSHSGQVVLDAVPERLATSGFREEVWVSLYSARWVVISYF